MPNSLVAATGSACIHVLSDIVEDVGPVVFPSEHLGGFGRTRVSHKVVVVVRLKQGQSEVEVLGDIQGSFSQYVSCFAECVLCLGGQCTVMPGRVVCEVDV